MPGIDFDGEREIFFVGLFDHSRDSDKIDMFWKSKPAGYRRSCQNENIDVFPSQMGCYSHGSSYVSKTIGVMGIH